jgi:hypothetical protein
LLRAFSFSILSQHSSLCWWLKWPLHVTYPAILVKELGLYMHYFSDVRYFCSFSLFQLVLKHVLLTKYISHVDRCPGPLLPWYHTLCFLPVRIYEGLCMQKFCGWPCNPSCKDNGSKLKCVERSVDPYMGRTGLLSGCDQGFHVLRWTPVCVQFLSVGMICKVLYIYICFGYHSVNLKNMNKTFVDTLYQTFRVMSSLSFKCG